MLSSTNKKHLRFVIALGAGDFGAGANVITLEGFRASADIDNVGGQTMGAAQCKIYGMALSDMSAITTLQWDLMSKIPNTIEIFAIDGASDTLVFSGNIFNAWADLQSAPDVFLHIQAQAAWFNQIDNAAPISFDGDVSVASVMAQLAKKMGMAFENNGVDKTLTNCYLASSTLAQVQDVAEHAGIDFVVDKNTLAIMPRGLPRVGLIPLISADTGLIGYPTFNGYGVSFQCLFNPALVFGGAVELDTMQSRAKGQWVIANISLRLQSETPNGAWFSSVLANQTGLAIGK